MEAKQPTALPTITIATLNAAHAKTLIIHQLEKLMLKHSADQNLKTILKNIIRDVDHYGSKTPLVEFKDAIESGRYPISESIKKSLLGFVEMECHALTMETVKSDKLKSHEILSYIKAGREHAEKAKNLDLVIVVGNTGAGKSTMINALDGCKLVWGKYFKDVKNSEGVLLNMKKKRCLICQLSENLIIVKFSR
jgi:Flp pilus assembly CpaF family ATPase